VVAKPHGTRTPSCASEPIISPSDAFLPPTVSTSRMANRSKGMTWAFNAAPSGLLTRRNGRKMGDAQMPNNRARHHLSSVRPGRRLRAVSRRTIFFVSDQTGVTAETLGHSLMTQFEGLEFRPATLPFVSSVDKAQEALRRINHAAEEQGLRPIVFSTLVQDELREIVVGA